MTEYVEIVTNVYKSASRYKDDDWNHTWEQLKTVLLLLKNSFLASFFYFHLIFQRQFERGLLLFFLVLWKCLCTLAKCFNNTHFVKVKSALLPISIEVNSTCFNWKHQTFVALNTSKTHPFVHLFQKVNSTAFRQTAKESSLLELWEIFKLKCLSTFKWLKYGND